MKNKRWIFIIIILAILAFFSFFVVGILSLFVDTDIEKLSGNVALVSIKGAISTEKSGFISEVTTSDDIIELIEKADNNPSIKAILLEINSPGGTPVASEEIANKIKEVNKTTVAWIRDVGASGAYWVASASDYIVANRMSVTGSIGVLASYIEFAGIIERYNMSYRRFVGGEYKDVGDPFKKLTAEEKIILQNKIDKIHEYFVKEVAKNRNLKNDKLKDISTGMFYLGSEAKELGLVDELGGKEEAIKIIEKKLNITAKIVEYKKEKTFWDIFANVFNQNSFYVGEGIGSALVEKARVTRGIDIWT